MATKLDALPAAPTPLAGTELLYLATPGNDYQITVDQLLARLTGPANSNFRIRLAAGKGLQLANLDNTGALLGWRSVWILNGALTISDTDDNSA